MADRDHQVHLLCTDRDPGPGQGSDQCTVHPFAGLTSAELVARVRALELDVLLLNPERSPHYHGIRANVLRPGYGTDQGVQNLRSVTNPLERGVRRVLRRTPPEMRKRERERAFYEGGVGDGDPEPEIVAISRYMEREILSSYDVSGDRIHLVHNGVDLEEFHPARREERREEARRRLGVPPDAICLLNMAHNYRRKGVWELMEWVRRLREQGMNAHLLVAGRGTGGRQRRKARALASRYGITDAVHMPGAVHPATEAYAAADVFIFPTWHDAFGFVVLEAMASGLPVVTTPYAGAAEVVEEGVSGFVVHPDDAATAVNRLLTLADPHRRAGMGRAARRVAEEHGEERNFREMEAVFRAAAHRRKGPVA